MFGFRRLEKELRLEAARFGWIGESGDGGTLEVGLWAKELW